MVGGGGGQFPLVIMAIDRKMRLVLTDKSRWSMTEQANSRPSRQIDDYDTAKSDGAFVVVPMSSHTIMSLRKTLNH
jgi:hypothetical protein